MSYIIEDFDTRTGKNRAENARCIYSYLKYKGCNDNQVAGVLANWDKENSLDPTIVEAYFLYPELCNRFEMTPQKQEVINNINSYTLEKVLPKTRIAIWNNYKGTDGKYYCGIGFGQFTGPAAQKLIGTATASNQYWWGRDYQLAYAFSIYRDWFLKKYKEYNGSASDCAYYFALNWEGNTHEVGAKQAIAPSWLEKIKGYEVDTDYAQAVDALAKRLNPSYETGGAAQYLSGGSFFASPEKLYSSDNYSYIEKKEEEKPTSKELLKKVAEKIKAAVNKASENVQTNTNTNDNNTIPDIANITNGIVKDLEVSGMIKTLGKYNEKPKTIVQGSTSSSVLPVVTELVEAPYFEVEIGGIKFGGYHNNKIPNYVRSLSVKKTNGTINDYTIQLVHQIRPGDNPNYIDNVLSKVGYDIITIKYGNANTGQIFQDYEALITDVHEKFDFTNCNINYTIIATSVCSILDSQKHNYPPYIGKISDKIRQLLYNDKSSDLLSVFNGMRNQSQVEKEGLIPTNDSVVSIGAVSNVTAFQYLQKIVGVMRNNSSRTQSLSSSQYFLTIIDSAQGTKLKIKEVVNSVKSISFMYEVNVGYPDDNFVLNFSVNTNFSWAVAYESAKSIKRYEYDLDSAGNLKSQNIPAVYRNKDNVIGSRNLWTSLTRYPIDATLTIRGLLQSSLLLQYIKINNVVYGAKRINSGVYIVTEQVDTIGNGVYTTVLSLTRVAGDDEYINIDGRVIT